MARLNPNFTNFTQPGQIALRRPASGRRHRPGHPLQRQDPDHGRADRGTRPGRDGAGPRPHHASSRTKGIGIFLISHDIHDVFDLVRSDQRHVPRQLVGTVNKDDVTTDDVLGMIILGKKPERDHAPGAGRAPRLTGRRDRGRSPSARSDTRQRGAIELESSCPAMGAALHRLRVFGHDLLRTPDDPADHDRDDPFFWGALSHGAVEQPDRPRDRPDVAGADRRPAPRTSRTAAQSTARSTRRPWTGLDGCRLATRSRAGGDGLAMALRGRVSVRESKDRGP